MYSFRGMAFKRENELTTTTHNMGALKPDTKEKILQVYIKYKSRQTQTAVLASA